MLFIVLCIENTYINVNRLGYILSRGQLYNGVHTKQSINHLLIHQDEEP